MYKSNERFKFLFKVPGQHAYWQDTVAGMIAVSDESGTTPDTTDDGILWVDTTKPIIASGTGFYIPLLIPRTSRAYKRNQQTISSTCCSPTEARYLVERLSMKVSVDGLELSKVCGYEHHEHPDNGCEHEQGYC
jgi:hypothetical protein